MSDKVPDIVARCRKLLGEDTRHHDVWAAKVDRWYRAYRGEYDDERERQSWRSDIHPPIIFQIIETLASGLSDAHPRWQVKPRPRDTTAEQIMAFQDAARQVEMLLAAQRDEDGMVGKQRKHRLQGLIAGLTVWKTYWRLEEQPRTRTVQGITEDGLLYEETVTEPQVVKDGPCVDLVDVRDFIWPESATSLETAPQLHHRVWLTFDQLKEQEKAGYYRNVDQLRDTRDQSGDGSQSIREQGLFQVDRTRGRIKVVEHWLDRGKRVVTLANDTVLLRDRPNPFAHGQYPFIAASPLPDLFRVPGVSVVELVADLQRMLWDLMRQRHDNLEYLNNAVILVPDNTLQSEYVFAPGEQWLVEAFEQAPRGLELPTYPADVSLQAEQIIKADIQAIPGASPALIGQTDQIQQTATEVSLLANLAQRRLAAQKQQFTMADVAVAEQWIKLNDQFLTEPKWVATVGEDGQEGWRLIDPDGFRGGDYGVEVEQMEESLVRQERLAEAQSRLQVALTAAAPMAAMGTPLNVRAFVDDVLHAAGVDNTDRYYSAQPQPQLGAGGPPQGGPTGTPGPAPQDQGVSAPQATDMNSPSNAFSQSPVAATSRLMSMSGGPSNA